MITQYLKVKFSVYEIFIMIGLSIMFAMIIYNYVTNYDEESKSIEELKGILYYDVGKRNIFYYYVEDLPRMDIWNMTTVENSFNNWEKINENLHFVQIESQIDSDIVLQWRTEIVKPKDPNAFVWGVVQGGYISVEYVDNCNGNSLYYRDIHIEHVLTHEIGHIIGILEHSSNENNVLFNNRTGIDNLETFGLEIPLDNYYSKNLHTYYEEEVLLNIMGDPKIINNKIFNKTFNFITDTNNTEDDILAYIDLREIIDCYREKWY